MQMLEIGHQLFAKINKKKRFAHSNHEIHFLARDINDWLPEGIRSVVEGNYTPRHLRRYYFKDEMVDQLHVSDRILQHLLLKQLKPTFRYVMNPNCLHLDGPSGVKRATQRICQVLEEENPNYIIRADIKSFYRSIPHYKLIQDIKGIYDDPKVQSMLENIITNAIETPRGYKNSSYGIALRGPLSQFFSAIYLKPLDDAFNGMDVTYVRYQDDILILCKTKRQLNRCRRRLMEILQERRLSLSRKKSRIGCIQQGFHFLGIHYPGTQIQDDIKIVNSNSDQAEKLPVKYSLALTSGGGVEVTTDHSQNALLRIRPHPRTLRKAREQVKQMVHNGFSAQYIRSYLRQWTVWWVSTSKTWNYNELLIWFMDACWDINIAAPAASLLQSGVMRSRKMMTSPGVWNLVPAPALDQD